MVDICWLVVPEMRYGVARMPDSLMIIIGLEGIPVRIVFAMDNAAVPAVSAVPLVKLSAASPVVMLTESSYIAPPPPQTAAVVGVKDVKNAAE